MPTFRKSQQGAVAIIVGLTMVILVGMLALVVDLGHLYLAKTGLQNAADAGALSGAKQLNGTSDGICCDADSAVAWAIETAGENTYLHDLGQEVVTITQDDIEFGSTPDGPWVDVATAQASPGDKTFIKVDTGTQDLRTWFAPVLGLISSADFSTTATFGMAVAGKYVIDITPIAMCELPDPGTVNELGYERGVSYKVKEVNPIGPGTMYWLDPESNVPGVCPVTSTNATLPYVCAGKISYTPIVGETVNTNTGISDPQLAALDSRFGDYSPQAKCDPATAPADTNVKEYFCATSSDCAKKDSGVGSPSRWMEPDPTRQSIEPVIIGGERRPIPYASRTFSNYGVLWAGFRPDGKTVSDWSSYYGGTATTYPEPSPYAQTSGDYFEEPLPAYRPGVAKRRVLNMVIVDCHSAGGVCRPVTVMGIGRFLMQRKANIPGDKDIYVEFGGLLSTPFPPSDIRLYR